MQTGRRAACIAGMLGFIVALVGAPRVQASGYPWDNPDPQDTAGCLSGYIVHSSVSDGVWHNRVDVGISCGDASQPQPAAFGLLRPDGTVGATRYWSTAQPEQQFYFVDLAPAGNWTVEACIEWQENWFCDPGGTLLIPHGAGDPASASSPVSPTPSAPTVTISEPEPGAPTPSTAPSATPRPTSVPTATPRPIATPRPTVRADRTPRPTLAPTAVPIDAAPPVSTPRPPRDVASQSPAPSSPTARLVPSISVTTPTTVPSPTTPGVSVPSASPQAGGVSAPAPVQSARPTSAVGALSHIAGLSLVSSLSLAPSDWMLLAGAALILGVFVILLLTRRREGNDSR
jgi:hypothetical protein